MPALVVAGLLVAVALVAGALLAGARDAGAGADAARPAGADAAVVERAYGRLPLRFEPNRGQSDPRVRFMARGPSSTLFLTRSGATLALQPRRAAGAARDGRPAVLGLALVGANPSPQITGLDRQAGGSNYLAGSDRSAWRTAVPGFGQVSYRSVYPGTDLVFHGRQRQLEYDFVLAPGADPGRIALKISGARSMRLARSGDLLLHTAAGTVRQHAPVIYQRAGGRRERVRGSYVLHGRDRVGFRVGAYDRSRALVIDPVLAYGTHLGGGLNSENVTAVALEPGCATSCAAYVTGQTASADFPVLNAAQGTRGGTGNDQDVFVAKLNGDGSALAYSTYLGGSARDDGRGIAVDSSGRAFVTGVTASAGGAPPGTFPTTPGAFQGSNAGSDDAFLAVLSASGSALAYSTFLGGGFGDSGTGVAVEGGRAYVTGNTTSPGFPTTPGAFDTTCGTAASPCTSGFGTGDAFVAKADPAAVGAASLVHSTFLGGGAGDGGAGIAVDPTGAAYVAGTTAATDFPATPGAFRTTLSAGSDAFAAKILPNGSGFAYATYLGGTSSDSAGGIAIDPACASACRAHVAGSTSSTDFPTVSGARDATANGSSDVFASRLSVDGSALEYSTYLGGSDADSGVAVAVRDAKAYVAGTTLSKDFPVKDPVERDQGPRTDFDAFLSELDPGSTGSASLVYSTRLGGNGHDRGQGVAVDGSGSAYVGAGTDSSRGDFPTTVGALQPGFAGGLSDGFVTKMAPVEPASPYVSGVTPFSGSVSGSESVRITGRGFGPATAVRFGSTPAASFTVDSPTQITAVSPPRPVGPAPVTVTTSSGTSAPNPITVFSYGEGRMRPTDAPAIRGQLPVGLKDGRVLLIQPNFSSDEEDGPPNARAQLYDPKTESWTETAAPTGLPADYRPGDLRTWPFTATLLHNGKVLVTTSAFITTAAASAQLYDPANGGSWTRTAGPPSVSRIEASATRLDGPACRSAAPPSYCGNVLIAGGRTVPGGANRATAELYNPTTDSFSSAGTMSVTHRSHGAVLLDDTACHNPSPPSYCGKVLIVGGFDFAGVPIAKVDLYDPATNSWSEAAPVNQARARNTPVQLADGRVLDPGGRDVAGARVEGTELYDPATNEWRLSTTFPGTYPSIPRLLPNRKALTVEAAGGIRFGSGERTYLFDPALRDGRGDWVFAGIKPAVSQTAGAALLTSDPLRLSADLRTFGADPAVCGTNCNRVLVVGGDVESVPPFAELAFASLYAPEREAATIPTPPGQDNPLTEQTPALSESPFTSAPGGSGGSGTGKGTSKLEVARSRVRRAQRRLDVLAPISRLASGRVRVQFVAAGQRLRFDRRIDSAGGRVRFSQAISGAQAGLGSGILTLSYPGDPDTRPQEVRLRAADRPALLDLGRPRIVDGRLRASGTVSPLARGVVRVQLEYVVDGDTKTVEFTAPIRDGRWGLDVALSQAVRDDIARRQGAVHSYTLFTGYLPRRIRGEMESFQVLGHR